VPNKCFEEYDDNQLSRKILNSAARLIFAGRCETVVRNNYIVDSRAFLPTCLMPLSLRSHSHYYPSAG